MDLALALRFAVAVGQLALAGAIAALWRGRGGRALALLFALRGGAGVAAASSHAAGDARLAQAAFVVAAALSLALAAVALALAFSARGRWVRWGAAATFVLALAAILVEPRLYGELDAGAGATRVDEDGPLVAAQALVWVGYAGILARLGHAEAAGAPSRRHALVRRLLLAGFALDIAWIATGALRGLATGAPARVLDHLVADASGAARVGLLLQVAGLVGLLYAAGTVLRGAARGRSPAALAAVLLAALAAAAALRWSLRPGPILTLVDAAWRLALPALVAAALLSLDAKRDALAEEAEAESEWELG